MKNKTSVLSIELILAILSGIFTWLIINYPQNYRNTNVEPFNYHPQSTGNQTPTQEAKPVSLIAVGDISYSRGVGRVVRYKNDINYPFANVKDYFKTADIVLADLETPITPGREIMDGEMVFRSNPGTEKALKEAGISMVSLANNHTPDFGDKGLIDTFTYLTQAGIDYIGAGENIDKANTPLKIEKNGIKFAFLAYNDSGVVPKNYEATDNTAGTAFMDIEKMTQTVEKAKNYSDIVVVVMHSGTEYESKPNQTQVNFARSAIDSGADLVIGGHPHVVQTAELYKGKYIFYSLGNFILDQMWSLETRQGIIIKATFNKTSAEKIELVPTIIENYSQPRMAKPEEATKIIKRLGVPTTEKNGVYEISPT